MTEPEVEVTKKPKSGIPLILVGLVAAALIIGFVITSRKPVPAKVVNTGFDGYPNGVWPSRVQPFGDRLVEARAGTQGSVRLFFMTAKDKMLAPITAPTIEGEIISVNGDSSPITLRPEPVKGVPGGGSWVYYGKADIARIQTNKWGLYGVRVTIPYQNVNHSVQWKPNQTTVWIDTRHLPSAGDAKMPDAPTSDVERKLFLTPGGKYTAADIAANKHQVASVVYRGILATHSMKPKKGTIICPITNTLANPQFTWIIDGKTYRFCCPPCIAEFVRQAKEKPKSIHPPGYYIAH